MKYFLSCLILSGIFTQLFAQEVKIREEDNFWRRRVVKRIDMNEKINQPIHNHALDVMTNGKYAERNGLIVALLNGAEKGDFLAYNPDTGKPMDWQTLFARMKEQGGIWEDNNAEIAFAEEDDKSGNTFASWNEEIEEQEKSSFLSYAKKQKYAPQKAMNQQINYTPYEQEFQIVEDWIFDKNRSVMAYNIDYFQVIWSDPTGISRDKVLANFRYKEVETLLEKTQWQNRMNEAETRNMKEIFDLHIYHGIVINVSGREVQTLYESQKREQEMIDYEHNLWNY
jgi:hypothetical protein